MKMYAPVTAIAFFLLVGQLSAAGCSDPCTDLMGAHCPGLKHAYSCKKPLMRTGCAKSCGLCHKAKKSLPTVLPVQFATENERSRLAENEVRYYKAILCPQHYNIVRSKLVRLSIVLPHNTEWINTETRFKVDVASGPDFEHHYLGSNYEMTIADGIHETSLLSGMIVMSFAAFKHGTIYFRATTVGPIGGALSFNIDFVDQDHSGVDKDRVPNVKSGPSSIPRSSGNIQYHVLSQHGHIMKVAQVVNLNMKYYKLYFCGAEYGGRDFMLSAMVSATDAKSGFLTLMCPINMHPRNCHMGANVPHNYRNSGINLIQVSTRATSSFDIRQGVLLGIEGYGGNQKKCGKSTNNFEVHVTTNGL